MGVCGQSRPQYSQNTVKTERTCNVSWEKVQNEESKKDTTSVTPNEENRRENNLELEKKNDTENGDKPNCRPKSNSDSHKSNVSERSKLSEDRERAAKYVLGQAIHMLRSRDEDLDDQSVQNWRRAELLVDQTNGLELEQQLMELLEAVSESEIFLKPFSKLVERANLDPHTKRWILQYTSQPSHHADRLSRSQGFEDPMMFKVEASNGTDTEENVSSPRSADSLLHTIRELDDIDSWDFDISQYPLSLTKAYAAKIFLHFDLLKRFHIPEHKFNKFLTAVANSYQPNADYHNFYHAVDVLHGAFLYCIKTELIKSSGMYSMDILCLFIASISHDIDHPGTNNAFLVNSGSELAIRYNDQSVLEHHHCATCFAILKRPECNILSKLSPRYYAEARKTIITSILATDMSHHFEIVARLDQLFNRIRSYPPSLRRPPSYRPIGSRGSVTNKPEDKEKDDANANTNSNTNNNNNTTSGNNSNSANGDTSSGTRSRMNSTTTPIGSTEEEVELEWDAKDWAPNKREDIRQLVSVVLHCSDISNPTKKWPIAKVWADKIIKEFYRQGDQEKEIGLPVSPFMDRDASSQALVSLNFIDFVVSPLLTSMMHMYPGLSPCAENIVDNRRIWNEILLAEIENNLKLDESKKRSEKETLFKRAEQFKKVFVFNIPPSTPPRPTLQPPKALPLPDNGVSVSFKSSPPTTPLATSQARSLLQAIQVPPQQAQQTQTATITQVATPPTTLTTTTTTTTTRTTVTTTTTTPTLPSPRSRTGTSSPPSSFSTPQLRPAPSPSITPIIQIIQPDGSTPPNLPTTPTLILPALQIDYNSPTNTNTNHELVVTNDDEHQGEVKSHETVVSFSITPPSPPLANKPTTAARSNSRSSRNSTIRNAMRMLTLSPSSEVNQIVTRTRNTSVGSPHDQLSTDRLNKLSPTHRFAKLRHRSRSQPFDNKFVEQVRNSVDDDMGTERQIHSSSPFTPSSHLKSKSEDRFDHNSCGSVESEEPEEKRPSKDTT